MNLLQKTKFINEIIIILNDNFQIINSSEINLLDLKSNLTFHDICIIHSKEDEKENHFDDPLSLLGAIVELKQYKSIFFKITNILPHENQYILTLKSNNITIENYKDVYSHSPVSVLIADLKGNIEYVNASFESMTGFISKEIIGKNVNIFKSGKQPRKFYKNLWEDIKLGKRWSGEFINVRKDNTDLYESAYIQPIMSYDGKITNYIKISEDVTVHRKLIELLMRSYQVIEGVMNNTNPVMLVDERHQVVLANRHFYSTTGYLSEDLTGSSMYDFLEIKDRDVIEKKCNAIFDQKIQEAIIETGLHKHDQSYIFISMKISLLNKEHNGKNIVISIEDITEKKKTEETLAQLSYAVEQSPSSVIITDTQGNIEYVNPKFSLLTGYSVEEVIGRNPRILKSGEQDDEYYKILWDTILEGDVWRGEFHNKKKNGELYWEYASISGIKNENNEIYRFLAVKEDITERKKAEEALRVSEEDLRKKNSFMEREILYAQTITRRFLPEEPPSSSFIKADYRYMPLDAIGGDYFTFFNLSDNAFSVFLGDVSGHGVSAALFLALVKSVTDKLTLNYGLEPGRYIEEVNKELSSNMASYFITGIYCLFQPIDSGVRLIFAKGGHPPPIVHKKDSDVSQLLQTKGKPLGLFSDELFETYEIDLEKGDRVFLYTDGINETMDHSQSMLHYDGLLSLVSAGKNVTLDKSLDAIIDGVHDHRGIVPIDDDIVLIGLEVK